MYKSEVSYRLVGQLGDQMVGSSAERLKLSFPELFVHTQTTPQELLITRSSALNQLFPYGGFPFGHLFEITGGPSSGKSSLLNMILGSTPESKRIVYIDASGTFFPNSVLSAGVAVERLGVLTANSSNHAVRLAESLLTLSSAIVLVSDFTGTNSPISLGLIHRFRASVIKQQALVFFLTDSESNILPPSSTSAQLTISRHGGQRVLVTVTKSRLMQEGNRAEVDLS